MEAIVQVINPNKSMYAAEIEGQEEFVIFEVLDTSEPEIGDIISHPDFYSMGSEVFNNLTQQSEFEVFVQNICGADLVKQQCLL